MEDYNEFKVLATDGEIDLAMPTYVDESYKHFDIFLHNTNTFVGYIWYDNTDDEEIVSYFGNVGYEIKKEYRGNSYVLKALKLLKNIMMDKKLKSMVFNIERNNIYSKNVVKKLGARKVHTRVINGGMEKSGYFKTHVDVYEYKLKKKGKLKWKGK